MKLPIPYLSATTPAVAADPTANEPMPGAAFACSHHTNPSAICVLALSCLFSARLMAADAAPPRPNILLLYADDMGYGDLGANNPASKIPTPNLDRLAAEGMRFTDGHSSSGICSPSRYALLTGRHHWRDFHGIVNSFGPSVFRKGQLTLPQMLREKGYTTACIGKWHLGWNWDAIRKPGTPPKSVQYTDFDWSRPVPDGPLDHGFDHYFGDTVINFPPYAWIHDDRLLKPPDTNLMENPVAPKEGRWECRPGPACSEWDFYQNLPTLTRKAVDYVRSRQGQSQPFFLYMAFPSPHAPIIPNDEFDGTSQAGPFGDYVFQTDDACGRLLSALREAGLDQNTVVIFTADNGPENYAYARDETFDHWSSEPFRGLKRDTYEGGHHVPFLIKWPGVTKPGTVTGALISQVDFMATLAAVLNYDLPRNAAEDSHNFLPWLQGRTQSPPRTTIVHNTKAEEYAIRQGDWLLVDGKTGYSGTKAPAAWNAKHHQPPDDDQPVELYNLKEDIGQCRNLAARQPEKVAELQALLRKLREQGHSAPRSASSSESSPDRMQWWADARFGLFLHWGLYAVAGGEWEGRDYGKEQGGNSAEWLMLQAGLDAKTYGDALAPKFNPVRFDAREWVARARDAGMKYIVITAKHHDGFSMFESAFTDYDVVDATPFRRDPIKELAAECKRQGLHFGVYYSHRIDWKRRPTTMKTRASLPEATPEYVDFTKRQLRELLTHYPEIEIVWFDLGGDEPQNRDYVDIVREASPNCIVSGRIGRSGGEALGDYLSLGDRRIPPARLDGYAEACMTMRLNWGYDRNDRNWKSTKTLLDMLVLTAARGANMILNVGPQPDGDWTPEEKERLAALGRWLQRNGDAIYATQASPFDWDFDWGTLTTRDANLYLHVLERPQDGRLVVKGLENQPLKATLVGGDRQPLPLKWQAGDCSFTVDLAKVPENPLIDVVRVEFAEGKWSVAPGVKGTYHFKHYEEPLLKRGQE